ncbi:AAA domain-containing protein [Streptomyces sp. 846.5]|nr:AAA family ATPase [Streptomyces sp. 846.5]TDT97301.1 AAA domain-containing protein [Streptomyces sp. 846.5]
MRIDSIAAQDFLSFHRMHLDVDAGLNVITGPNGAGKSNLCTVVDVVQTFLRPNDQACSDRLAKFEEAGRNGVQQFTLSLGTSLDQPWEHALVEAFVRAAAICTAFASAAHVSSSYAVSALGDRRWAAPTGQGSLRHCINGPSQIQQCWCPLRRGT